MKQLQAYSLQNCNRAVLFFETVFERQGNAFAGKEITGADGKTIGKNNWGQTYTFDKMWIIDRVANLGKMIER